MPGGFGNMPKDKQIKVASRGGSSVKNENRSFSKDRELASRAGITGGANVPPGSRSFSQNRELAAEAGRKGGLARGKPKQKE
jgi:uncharacterized protein